MFDREARRLVGLDGDPGQRMQVSAQLHHLLSGGPGAVDHKYQEGAFLKSRLFRQEL